LQKDGKRKPLSSDGATAPRSYEDPLEIVYVTDVTEKATATVDKNDKLAGKQGIKMIADHSIV